MKISVLSLLFLILASGCSSLHKSQPSSGLSISPVTSKELHADITVNINKKLSGAVSRTKIFGITTSGPKHYSDGVAFSGSGGFLNSFFGSDDLKAAAAFKAMNKSDADVLVAPQYIVSEEGFLFFYSKVSVKVTGYPGVIKKIE